MEKLFDARIAALTQKCLIFGARAIFPARRRYACTDPGNFIIFI